MDRLLLTLVIIFTSLIAGYAFQQWVRSGRSPLNEDSMKALRLRVQKGAMFGLIPLSAMLSLWGLPSPDARLLALPALGVAAWVCGGVLALLLSRLMGLERRQAGSMFCCGTFTNIGAVGSLVSVMLFGEQTIAIAALYRLCEEIYYFLFDPKQGFAVQCMYTADGSLDEAYRVKQDELVEFPYGYHTTVSTPGYQTYFLWLMAGDYQGFNRSNDPIHDWVK